MSTSNDPALPVILGGKPLRPEGPPRTVAVLAPLGDGVEPGAGLGPERGLVGGVVEVHD